MCTSTASARRRDITSPLTCYGRCEPSRYCTFCIRQGLGLGLGLVLGLGHGLGLGLGLGLSLVYCPGLGLGLGIELWIATGMIGIEIGIGIVYLN